MTRTTQLYGAALIGALCLSACDSQASTEYRGEALLTLTGSVNLGETRLEGQLVPALVSAAVDGYMEIFDIDVSGSFPADFTLRVYEPPPLANIGDLFPIPLADEVQGAIEYITAVPSSHPSAFRFGSEVTGDGQCEGSSADSPCELDVSWCIPAGECRREHYVCANRVAWMAAWADDFSGCTLTEGSGDSDLKIDPYTHFAGISENYFLLYLEHEAPADSVVAYAYSGKVAMPAGYNLIKVQHFEETAEQRSERQRCEDDALLMADRIFPPEGVQCSSEPELCARWSELALRAQVDLDCPHAGVTNSLVEDPASESIQVRLRQDFSAASLGLW